MKNTKNQKSIFFLIAILTVCALWIGCTGLQKRSGSSTPDFGVENGIKIKNKNRMEGSLPLAVTLKGSDLRPGEASVKATSNGNEGALSQERLALSRAHFLIVDFGSDGIQLSEPDVGIPVQRLRKGVRSEWSSAWTVEQTNDAFIVIDSNQNNEVDGSFELIGEATRFKVGGALVAGIEGLRQIVGDRLDKQDPIYDKLLLWFDRNQNGMSEFNELEPLSARIKTLSLIPQKVTDESLKTRGARHTLLAQSPWGRSLKAVDFHLMTEWIH